MRLDKKRKTIRKKNNNQRLLVALLLAAGAAGLVFLVLYLVKPSSPEDPISRQLVQEEAVEETDFDGEVPVDGRGNPCAVVDIYAPDISDMHFESNFIVDNPQKNKDHWRLFVYVSQGKSGQNITITKENYPPFHLTFDVGQLHSNKLFTVKLDTKEIALIQRRIVQRGGTSISPFVGEAPIDKNGNHCAVVDIYIPDASDMKFECDQLVGKPIKENGKWRLYVQPTDDEAQQIAIHKKGFEAFNLIFKAGELKAKKHYKCELDIVYETADNDEKLADSLTERAYELYLNKDYENSLQLYTKAAELGNVRAIYNVGMIFYNGYGVTIDEEEAAKWFYKAAQKGYGRAQSQLAAYCMFGNGIGLHDSIDALQLFKQAAEQRVPKAMFYLGYIYENDKKWTDAILLYSQAADLGDADAQCCLGNCYYKGNGVQKDLQKAVFWYTKSAMQGDEDAQFQLGYCYENGLGVEKDFYQAVHWYSENAKQGDCDNQYFLGDLLRKHGDYEKAVYWLKQAEEQGDKDAYCELAKCAINSDGSALSYEMAHQYIDEVIQNDTNDNYIYELIDCYDIKGSIYLKQNDKSKAREYLKKILDMDREYYDDYYDEEEPSELYKYFTNKNK